MKRCRTAAAQPGVAAASLLGSYKFEARADWCCPHCKSRENPELGSSLFWQCIGCAGAFHCVGSVGRGVYCACGQFTERRFEPKKNFEVRGTRSVAAATPRRPPDATQVPKLSAATALPRSSPSAAPRLTDTASLLRLP